MYFERCLATAAFLFVGACIGTIGDDAIERRGNGSAPPAVGADAAPESSAQPTAAQCQEGQSGRSYVGIGGTPLEAGRVAASIAAEHSRIKPFSALAGEYTRVLGKKPASLDGYATTFGEAPPRWYRETIASAISVSSAYTIAFDGCLDLTKAEPAKYGQDPTATTATTVCTALTKQFWNRNASGDEVAACVAFATGLPTSGDQAEPDANHRWAAVCASVLSAAGFLAY